MSRLLGLALLTWGLGACSSAISLGNPHPDAGPPPAAPVPTVEVVPDPLDFGAVSVGTTSPSLAVTLLNAGTVPAVVSFLQGSNEGAFSTPGSQLILLPADQGTKLYSPTTFHPSAPGPFAGILSYQVCAMGSPDGGPCSSPQSIPLRGTGF